MNKIELTYYFILAFLKSLFTTIVQMAWAFAGLFLLAGMIIQFKQVPPTEFMYITGYLIAKWRWFFTVIFLFDLTIYYRELQKKK